MRVLANLLVRLILTFLVAAALFGRAEAANRFWVPITITGAANNGSGACRIQVGAGLATGKVTGETVTVASVGGATGCNVTTTITAIDSTHIDLVGTTFGGAYTSGGTISGGTWNATNIGNWGTSSGTGSGATVPVAADNVTFDGSSGGAPVTVAATINGVGNALTSISWGQFTSTLDFDTNNVSVTMSGSGCFTGTGTGSGRKLLSAGATFTCTVTTSSPALVSMTTTTGLDGASDFSGTWVLSGTNSFIRGFLTGGLSFGTLTVATNSSQGLVQVTGASPTFGTLNYTGPGAIQFSTTGTVTITNAFNWTVTGSAISTLFGAPGVTTAIHASAASTMDKWALRDITFNTSTVTITNGYDLGNNAGTYTLTGPTTGAGNIMIGVGL
jgi:hypothetical protein